MNCIGFFTHTHKKLRKYEGSRKETLSSTTWKDWPCPGKEPGEGVIYAVKGGGGAELKGKPWESILFCYHVSRGPLYCGQDTIVLASNWWLAKVWREHELQFIWLLLSLQTRLSALMLSLLSPCPAHATHISIVQVLLNNLMEVPCFKGWFIPKHILVLTIPLTLLRIDVLP